LAAADRVRSYDGKVLMDNIRSVAAAITASERTDLDSRSATAEDHANELITLLVAGAILNLLLLAGAYMVTRRSLNHSKLLLKKLRHNSSDISAVNQLSSSLQSCSTLSESATILQHFARQLFPDTRGAIYLMRASRNLLQLSASWNTDNNPMTDPVEPHDCWALRLGKTYERNVDGKELSCQHLHNVQHTTLCIPLMAQSDIVGLLSIEIQQTADLTEIRTRAELMATHTSAALASVTLREALRQQSIRDPLTGLYNRRYLEEAMERELLRARRNKAGLCVLMVDIDHFKQFNDTHGHQAGDLLLKEFGEYLRRHVRAEDIACRYGGEEFLIAMPGTDSNEARERAEMLRQNLISLKVHFQGTTLPTVTASFGAAIFPAHGDDRDALIRSADAALYLAKRKGRNRVWISGDQDTDHSV
ncbi:MAG: diguanylate cyclase, partial [Gammaproteobacteria bacterium]|nr:diguanylate cyclase [Gammaproteobacteria bacterium]